MEECKNIINSRNPCKIREKEIWAESRHVQEIKTSGHDNLDSVREGEGGKKLKVTPHFQIVHF